MSTRSKTIQEKMSELDQLVSWFDGDAFELEGALDRFKKAEALAADIEKDLQSLKNDVKVIKQKFDSET
ncbi:MAG: hypothetical protein ABIQ04_02205 [Candidatus Saccharimonadales bacterium]